MKSTDFAPTRWTLVSQAKADDAAGRTALSELCAAYYAPVVAFLRAEGRSDDAARDLAHEFFARVLGGDALARADAGRGRFRSYLLGAVKHFLSDQRARAGAAKRGGGIAPLPLDGDAAHPTDAGLQIPAPASAPPDAVFDRQWALTLITRTLEVVAAELRNAGKGAQFEALKPWLVGPGARESTLSQAAAGAALGMSEGAVKVAIHRLRQRFRETLKSEVAQTVPADADVDDKLRHLVAVLVRG